MKKIDMMPEFSSKLYFWFTIIFCLGIGLFMYQKISSAIVEIDDISNSLSKTNILMNK